MTAKFNPKFWDTMIWITNITTTCHEGSLHYFNDANHTTMSMSINNSIKSAGINVEIPDTEWKTSISFWVKK